VYGHALPFVLGQDFAGIVVGAGAGVKRYSEEDRVFGIAREHGAYAEYTMVPEDGTGQPLAHIPDGVGDADAAGLPTAGLTALAAIERMDIKARDTLAIVGVTGAVGQFATQLAKVRGARVIGVGSAAHASLGSALGLERYIAYDSEDVVSVLRQRYPEGIDALLDLVDDAQGLERFVDVVRRGGMIASTIRNSIEPGVFEKRDRVGLSVNLDESPQSSHDGLRRIVALVESGSLRVPIAAEHDLESGIEALAEVKAGKVTGKSLLTVEPRDF
jgi:NADPH:quinone reductase-like Zn-dependent oxidoreductase